MTSKPTKATKKKPKKRSKTEWKKGQSGNKMGRPKVELQQKILSRLNINEYLDIINRNFNKTVPELVTITQKVKAGTSELSAIEMAVISILLDCVKRGDANKLEVLLGRMIGKQQEDISVTLNHASICKLINDVDD